LGRCAGTQGYWGGPEVAWKLRDTGGDVRRREGTEKAGKGISHPRVAGDTPFFYFHTSPMEEDEDSQRYRDTAYRKVNMSSETFFKQWTSM
jgi:hypothetical protein